LANPVGKLPSEAVVEIDGFPFGFLPEGTPLRG
jgi:hypothetical protein